MTYIKSQLRKLKEENIKTNIQLRESKIKKINGVIAINPRSLNDIQITVNTVIPKITDKLIAAKY